MGLILDSSILIAAEREGMDGREVLQWLAGHGVRGEIGLSAITVMELEHGVVRASSERRRFTRALFLRNLMESIPIQAVTVGIALRAGRVDGQMRAQGVLIPSLDLLIGASALELGYGVATRNVRHFAMVPGLEIVTI